MLGHKTSDCSLKKILSFLGQNVSKFSDLSALEQAAMEGESPVRGYLFALFIVSDVFSSSRVA